ncbi:(2Fe-2S)-binding protein [Balneatrix alpica]|uniref:Bacterioferritin-associated ferredoxin n=2 Tax=Balneatrix alpica TaxID=75684 RepID=A0ABV5Z7N3_9GAMM
MLVCVCKRVSDRDVKSLHEQGVTSIEALSTHTGLGSCCGRCKPCAEDLLNELNNPTLAPTQAWGTSSTNNNSVGVWQPSSNLISC